MAPVAPVAPAAPSTPAPSPTPNPTAAISQTTTQTITQIQISSCLSKCDAVSQVQTAQQQAVAVQTIQPGSQPPSGGAQVASAVNSQPSGPVTQIQIGCVAHCFNVSLSDPATTAAGQQILAQLSSLLAPPAPPTAAPVSGVEQSVTDQTSCQHQAGPSSSPSETQSASQSATTVQVVEGTVPAAIEASLGSSAPLVPAASQTVQSTWQLQIGCLFDCVDSEQVQTAAQSSTTVELVTGPAPGSGGAVLSTVTQVIWQVQIGCLSWCYGIAQVQQVSTENTSVVCAPAPQRPSPPAPEAVSVTEPAASASVPAEPPPEPSIPTKRPMLPERLSFPRVVGRAALTGVGTAPAVGRRSASSLSVSARPVVRWYRSLTVASRAGSHHARASRRERSGRPGMHTGVSQRVTRAPALEARVGGRSGGAIGLAILAVLAALSCAVLRAMTTHPER